MNKTTCKCGCQRTFTDTSQAQNRMYYDPVNCRNRVVLAKKKAAYKSIQILCPCGCWNFFFTRSTDNRRRYYDRYKCRREHLKNNDPDQINQPQRSTTRVENRERTTASGCHRQGLPTEPTGVACADYLDCLEVVATGGGWKCDGSEWKDPQIKQVNTIGGSFAYCHNRSYSCTF